MSEKVPCIFYYGFGNVRTNDMGVDLSEFQCAEVELSSPKGWTIEAVNDWLTKVFGLDPEAYTVSVHALWTNSTSKIHWYLKPVDRTSKWVGWLKGCERRGNRPVALVLPKVKGGEIGLSNSVSHGGSGGFESGQSSQAHETEQTSEAPGGDDNSGEADGDEENGHMQNQMEEEDTSGESGSDQSDGSDEENSVEEVPILESWNQDFSNAMTVNDGHDSAWEYHQNNVEKGSRYPSKRHLQEAIVNWAMQTKREFKTKVSSQKVLTMECIDSNCPGRVHGYKPMWETTWKVSDVVSHTCVLTSVPQEHRNLSAPLLARLFYTEIVEGAALKIKAIQLKAKARYEYNISYGKAWRAKQKVLEMRFGTFGDAYDCVVRLLQTLQARNPGTYINIQDFYMPEFPTLRVLHRVFFSFGVCVEAFRHCRPVLCVDGTFLTGMYKGQILTAIGQDGNNQIVPLAFAFVESENTESWAWFFRQLKIGIVKDTPNVCVLHDRHAGILNAIKILKQPGPEEETPWIDMQSRWCMRHLGANFYSQFRSKSLMNLFKKLCKQNQQRKYDKLWAHLQKFTEQQVKQRKAAQRERVRAHAEAVAAQIATGPPPVEEEPQGLCDLPGFDNPGTERRVGRRIRNFEQWIEHEPVERWSLLHDTHGARYGVMTTNLAESYNFVLRGNRALPLTAIVEGILLGTVNYFRDRRELAVNHIMSNPNTPYCSKIMKYIADKMNKAQTFSVVRIGNQERRFEVRLPTDKFGCGNELRTHDVIIGNEAWPTCECTCNKPKLLHLPCSHVLAACGMLGLEHISFVSPYYLKEAVLNTWTGELQGFRSAGNFNSVNPGERRYIPDPMLLRTGRGRRQSRRIRNDMDESEAGGPTRQCFLCSAFGHWDTHCPTFGTGGATARGRGTRGRRGGGRGTN